MSDDTVILTKGGNVSLSKATGGAQRFVIGLGWNAADRDPPVDLDVAAYLCDDNDHIVPPVAVAEGSSAHGNFVYFRNLISADSAVRHSGDNLTGDGDGDDERIFIDTSKLDPRVKRIIIGIAIFDAAKRGQTFGLVRNAYANVYEAGALETAEANGPVTDAAALKNLAVARYDLEEDAGSNTVFQFGTFYEKDGDWKFKALGSGGQGDLGSILSMLAPNTTITR